MKRSILLILMAAALLLAACGDDAGEPTPAAEAPAAAELPAEAATATMVGQSPPATPAEAAPAVVEAAAVTATVPLTASALPTGTTPGTTPGTTGVVTATLTATACAVEPNPDLVGYDGLVDKLGCPLEEANFDAVAINEFGAGPDYSRFMLWFGSERQIYVLMPDATWLAYTDTWDESQPEILCNPDNLAEPTSPPLPRRGFGKLWCSVESVRAALGPIDREERLCQHSVTQRFEDGRLVACFEDATIRYFRILDSGGWDMAMVQ